MELLPNSKCLTKIKNHLQLGLIRELIGLLPVGKQWGYIYLNSNGTATFSIPFANTNYTLTTGQQRTSNNGFVQITGRNVNNVSFKFEWDSGQNKSGHCWWLAIGA